MYGVKKKMKLRDCSLLNYVSVNWNPDSRGGGGDIAENFYIYPVLKDSPFSCKVC